VDTKLICLIEDTFYEDAKKLGIDVCVIPQKRRSDMSVVKKISDIVNDEHYDIVHCHGARANTVSMFLKSKINVPMVTTIHSDYLLDFKDNFYKDLIFTPINTFALKKFDYYVAVTENFKDMLVSRGFTEEKIFTLYNGIDMETPCDFVEKDEFLKRFSIDASDKFIVGQAARLDKNKNVKMTLIAAKDVLAKRKDVLFLIAGEGDELDDLREIAKKYKIDDSVKFLGFVNDKFSFFNAIDLNVLSSNSESFPYVILEAAKMKKPTISTDVGGICELITDGEDGYLVEVENYFELSEKILSLVENRDLCLSMGEKIYKKVEEKFSVKSMANRQFEIYEEILSGRKR
jgi:glycosyltransferase involved in cell wall biosynthesis